MIIVVYALAIVLLYFLVPPLIVIIGLALDWAFTIILWIIGLIFLIAAAEAIRTRKQVTCLPPQKSLPLNNGGRVVENERLQVTAEEAKRLRKEEAEENRRKKLERKSTAQEKREENHRVVRNLIEHHKDELVRNRRQMIVDRGYGITDHTSWDAEIDFFISNVIEKAAPTALRSLGRIAVKGLIETACANASKKNDQVPTIGNPIEYEAYCADLLAKAGWATSTTKKSGDQGADVLARSGNFSMVIQCKQYSKNVGNAAVQEAFSAKQHYQTSFAAVVTNANYTKSAKTLAKSTGVMLLHHDDLPSLTPNLASKLSK